MQTVKIIAGHYGSGKTEVAVSLALLLAAQGGRVALADLDVVNPYFRSRERAALLEARGVRVISSSLGHHSTLDLPAVSGEVRVPLADPHTEVILDIGGDDVGARALAVFGLEVRRRGYDLWLVVNAYRPQTRTVEGVLKHLHAIQDTADLRFTGLISNTHAIRDTTPADVLRGLELTGQVSEQTGLPIVYVAAVPEVLGQVPGNAAVPRLPVGLYMRDEWM